MIQTLSNLWKEAKTPTDFIVVMWIYLLLGLFTIGWVSLVFKLITNPSDFQNISFGLIDYI